MSKRYFLSKNNFTGGYSLYSGAYGSRKEGSGNNPDYLVKELRNKIDKKRNNTELVIVSDNVPKDTIKDISKFFSDSKVKVSLTSLAAVE